MGETIIIGELVAVYRAIGKRAYGHDHAPGSIDADTEDDAIRTGRAEVLAGRWTEFYVKLIYRADNALGPIRRARGR